MHKQVVITADSAADLPPGIRQEFGIHFIPLHITLGETQGCDCVDIFPEDLYRAYTRQGIIPKTAAPSIGDYEAFFGAFTGSALVHISLGRGYSSSWQVAQMAARGLPEEEIHVVDSGLVTAAMGMLCVQAAGLRDEGLAAHEIAARLGECKGRILGHVFLDTLDMVARGGRVPAFSAMAANMLRIHPSVVTDGAAGSLKMGKKYRGKTDLAQKAWLEDTLAALHGRIDPALVFFMRTPGIPPEQYEELEHMARTRLPEAQRLVCGSIGCMCLSHCGFNCLELVSIKK